MSGLSFADESSVRAHLAQDESTAYLQQAGARLELLPPENMLAADVFVFQKFVGDLPIHGARVIVVENADGTVGEVFDDSTENLRVRPGLVTIDQGLAIDLAEADLAEAIDSMAKQVWFRTSDALVPAWEVTTSLADAGMPASPTHFETVIDAATGAILSERQIDTKTYAPGSPEAVDSVFPRIVINNTIGAQGSRDYAAPFDAVVQLGGCTGTLIAPNVVLSARHCGISAGTLVRFGDNSNSPTFTVTVQSSSLPDGNGSLLDGGDVSIHVLNGSVPANIAEPMRLIEETDALAGMLAATIGYGWNGLGTTGHQFNGDGFRWGGENIIDVYGSPAASGGSNIISTDFDNGTSGANTIGSSSSTPLEFEATTAPGDSGGPVLVLSGGEWVIAGVLSGGTTSTSVFGDISWWTGTAIYRDDIEAVGGDFVGGLEILFPDTLPDVISSAGGETFRIDIVESPDDPIVPGSGTFHVDAGAGFQELALAQDSATSFTATFPAPSACPTSVEYFVSFDLQSGATVTAPANASPTSGNVFSAVAADGTDFDNLFDFEAPVGFTVGEPGDNATTGVWVRVDPNGTGAQPEDDNTANGTIAWVTGQGSPGGSLGENDVDGGTTSLVSNRIDLTGTELATISYARWYSNSTGASPNADVFEVFVSDDDGQTFVLVETVGPAGAGTSGGWIETSFDVGSFVDLTSTVRVKFVASDLGSPSVVEAGVDDVRILGYSCSADVCVADVNGDGEVNPADFNAWVAAFNSQAPACDQNGDETCDAADFNAWILNFNAGC
ncbi:MAG: GC-type dockerin domain-anchored protein [Planctomycetota bacterium]